jgi:hypothetical protein
MQQTYNTPLWQRNEKTRRHCERKERRSETGGYCCPCPLISGTFLNITQIYTQILGFNSDPVYSIDLKAEIIYLSWLAIRFYLFHRFLIIFFDSKSSWVYENFWSLTVMFRLEIFLFFFRRPSKEKKRQFFFNHPVLSVEKFTYHRRRFSFCRRLAPGHRHSGSPFLSCCWRLCRRRRRSFRGQRRHLVRFHIVIYKNHTQSV